MDSHPIAETPFDAEALALQLDETSNYVPVLKNALLSLNDHLNQEFYKGTNVSLLTAERAMTMDKLLSLIWRRFDWEENQDHWRKTRISLVAVGGYGRGELHPFSDIDLLLLLERNNYELHKQNIQNFLTLLWDIGLEVGHSVRSIKECGIQARSDITIVTTLMESRTITGDEELRLKMVKRTGPKKIWPAKQFIIAKWSEQRDRHEKFEHTEYNLEPNIKSSPGGLRDIQTVMWIARRVSAAVSMHDLLEEGSLTNTEYERLEETKEFLGRIRYGLHLLSGRADDRLSFELQQKLAVLFGYADKGDLLAVEQFMKDYYRVVLDLRAINQLLMQHYDETILQAGKRASIKPLNKRFQIRNKYIEVTHDKVFLETPSALMEIFLLSGDNREIQGVSSATIRLITSQLYLINDEFRSDPEVTRLFIEVLKAPYKLFTRLRRMNRFGVLGAYLPEFGRIVGQMQFDLFHIYTVDAHTLQVIRNMRRFRYRNNEQKFPVAAHIIPRLPKIELLYIAGLYHDVAKGRGGNHSQLGVQDVTKFCHLHRMTVWDTNLVRWLVEHHLVMSVTAQRKDISDPEVIHEFALLVQDQVRLNYLYALTVADINATNPTLWNSWRASLLRQLYMETKRALRRGLENYADKSEYIAETQSAAIEKLNQRGINRQDVLGLWNNIDEEYFIRESVSNVVFHTESIHNFQKIQAHDDDPLILVNDYVQRQGEEGATQIFIYCNRQENHFAWSVAALDQLALNVLDARIFNCANNKVFNTFMVLESNGMLIGDNSTRIERVIRTLKDYLNSADDSVRVSNRRTPQQLKQFNIQTELTLTNDIANSQTVLDLVTLDRPGLLAIIGQIFVEFDLVIQGAKITTLGERVEDVFYLTDRHNQPVTDKTLRSNLENAVRKVLDQPAETAVS